MRSQAIRSANVVGLVVDRIPESRTSSANYGRLIPMLTLGDPIPISTKAAAEFARHNNIPATISPYRIFCMFFSIMISMP